MYYCLTLPATRLLTFTAVLFLSFFLRPVHLSAQTDFAPGQIMFTGYNSDDPDGFSFVILTDVLAGTIIYITDRGWSNSTGFRNDTDGEGTISFEFTADYPCGTSFVFQDNIGSAPFWRATDAYGVATGIVAVQSGGDPQGIEFNVGTLFPFPDGDQLFIYQSPAPTPSDQSSFITGIHMNGGAWNGGNTDDYSSQKPTGLADNQVVRFETEVDNAKYDCTPNIGSSATLQAAITNDNGSGGLISGGSDNWDVSNNPPFALLLACNFCCGISEPMPTLSGPNQVSPNQVFTISISGTLGSGASWQLFTDGCGEGTPLQTTTGTTFSVAAPPSEATVIYYVRSSQYGDCSCATLQVCIESSPYVECTECSGVQEVCGDCYLPDQANNPNLDSGCYDLRLIFVLDESGSVGGFEDDVEEGVLAFLNALNGQDAQVAFIEFSGTARVVNNYTLVDGNYIDDIEDYFNGFPGCQGIQCYDPFGGTNWHDAMLEVDALSIADLVLFFTDGIPTVWNTNGSNDCGSGSTTQTPEIVNPVKLSNKIKSEGTHMFMLGVGNGVNETRLQEMSGLDEYEEGTNTLGTSDYSIGNFEDLAMDLENFILELCRTTIVVEKEVMGPICNGQVVFRFRIINTGVESAATNVILQDLFPSGYSNPMYEGNDPFLKLCIGASCDPPQPPNFMEWVPFSVPPGDTAELLITVDVLPTGNYVNTATVTADNADTVSDTFNDDLEEDVPPTITCPAAVTIECTASTLPENTGSPTGINPDGPVPTFTYSDVSVSGSCAAEYTITRTWTATDNCSNTASCTQVIVVEDTTGPVITCPPNITVDCAAGTLPAQTGGSATATDACSIVTNIAYADVSMEGPCPAEPIIMRTWTATDACGNTSSCVQTISLDDNTAPQLQCAPNVTISCSSSTLPENTGFTTMKPNNCDGDGVVTYEDEYIIQPGPPPCSIVRTWTGTDDCGNSSTCVQIIVVEDNITPTINCPANVTISCTANTLPGSTGNATASDNCDAAPIVAFTDNISAGECENEYTITRTWTASDECGNANSCIQIIVVDDATPPEISCPANITISCTASTDPADTGGFATATDNCNGVIMITFADVTVESMVCPQEYTITRTWTAEDLCGSISTCVQTIVVDDSTAPMLTCPANITIECTAVTLPINTGTATVSDNCDATPELVYSDLTSSYSSCTQEYIITRTWTATDTCGNTSTCNQIITIDDSIMPELNCPANITIDCSASTLPVATGEATASDNCDVAPAITYLDVTVGNGCPQAYTITRTWRATDACGNFSTCNQTIVITDNISPVLTCPANTTIECTDSTLPSNTGSASADDNCDEDPLVDYTDNILNGDCVNAYTITRTWSVADACGNTTTCVQTIVVEDSTPPSLTCPENVTIECTENTLPFNTGNVTVSDNCDANPVVDYTDATVAGECPQEYTITRTWIATDVCGNSTTCVQMITVDDSTSPSLTCPANVTIECTASTLPGNTGSATASDNCDADPDVDYSDVTVGGACPQEYTITRTWIATDICGNTSTCVQVITIDDSVMPSIVCPPDVTIECLDSTEPENTGSATSVDNCDMAPAVTFLDVTMADPMSNGYFIERTWTSTDACGNTNTCLQMITVTNPLDPSILGIPFDTICSGDAVVFEAFDQGISPISYEWSFGSGSNPAVETDLGPHIVQYTYNGTNGSTGAWVILTVGSPGCEDVADTVSNIHVNAIPNANINATPPGNGCVFAEKTFVPVAPEMPGFSYEWDFGIGASLPNSTDYGPHEIEYSTSGMKTVQLIVTSNEQGSSCADTITITFIVNTCPGNITGKVLKSDNSPIAGVNLRLFADQNLDGIPDNNTAIRSVFTTSLGVYSMASLIPGYYVIVQTQPTGYISLYDEDTSEDFDSLSNINTNDNIIPVTLEASELDADNIFVEVTAPGSITGYVFEDFDDNQSPAPVEGISGVTIELFTDNDLNGVADPGGFVESTTTSSTGLFTFPDVATGSYVIIEHQPAGFTSVRDFDASNDSDEVPNTNQLNDTIPVTVTNAETDAGNYFIESSVCSGVVTNVTDGAPGSLRYMIGCSAANDTITFHPLLANQTLVLTAGRLEIDKNLYILSDVDPPLMIQSFVNGAIIIEDGVTAEFKNLQVISGLSGFPGAAFDNYGQLTLWDVNVLRNALLPLSDYLIFNGGSGIFNVKGMTNIESD